MVDRDSDLTRRCIFIVAAVMDLPEDSITADTALAELGANDLDRLDIILEAEGVADVELSDADAESIRTVGDLVDRLLEQRSAGVAA